MQWERKYDKFYKETALRVCRPAGDHPAAALAGGLPLGSGADPPEHPAGHAGGGIRGGRGHRQRRHRAAAGGAGRRADAGGVPRGHRKGRRALHHGRRVRRRGEKAAVPPSPRVRGRTGGDGGDGAGQLGSAEAAGKGPADYRRRAGRCGARRKYRRRPRTRASTGGIPPGRWTSWTRRSGSCGRPWLRAPTCRRSWGTCCSPP